MIRDARPGRGIPLRRHHAPPVRAVERLARRLGAGVGSRLAHLFGFSSDWRVNDSADPRIRLLVSGRVQGVGFRAWVVHRALELGLRGWVRNCRDGSVEVEASGPYPALARLRQLLEDGPALAHVFRIVEEPPHGDRLPDHFEIR